MIALAGLLIAVGILGAGFIIGLGIENGLCKIAEKMK